MNKLVTILILMLLGVSSYTQPSIDIIAEIRKCEQKVQNNVYLKYDSIEYYANRQLKLAQELADSLELGKAHLSLGIANFNLENFEKEINHLFTAKNIFLNLGNDYLMYRTYLEIASLYKEARSEEYSPTEILKEAANYFDSIDDHYLLARCYMELGLYERNKYRKTDKKDSILYYYEKALYHAKLDDEKKLLGEVINDIADYYLLQPHQDLDTVIQLSRQVLSLPTNTVKNKSVAYLNTYIAKREKGELDSLEYFLNQGFKLTVFVRPSRLSSQAADLKYRYFKRKGQYDSALHYHEKINDTRGTRAKDRTHIFANAHFLFTLVDESLLFTIF